MKKLTVLAVSKIIKPGLHAVGDGCYLQVTGTTGRSWIFRYRDRTSGAFHYMGLGSSDLVTLAEAREKCRAQRKLLLDGIDPLHNRSLERQRTALEAARGLTFRNCAEKYVAAHEASWRNIEHRRQWKSTLTAYVYPVIGHLAVTDVDTALVLKVIEPIWAKKSETASRLRNRIELILDWAAARQYRRGDNPARWRGHLDKLLPKPSKVRKVKHHPALPYTEMPAFLATLRQQHSIAALALEFIVLTAVRSGEAIGARWDEIDLAAGVWTIPEHRTKAEREHRVPLSKPASAILKNLVRDDGSEYVFRGRPGRLIYTRMLQRETLRAILSGATVHGFRSTFRDWAAECTAYPNHVVEMALAHAVGNAVEAAYRRGDLFEKRRRLMDAWGNYCSLPPVNANNVVAFV